jgi:hypothetical protein
VHRPVLEPHVVGAVQVEVPAAVDGAALDGDAGSALPGLDAAGLSGSADVRDLWTHSKVAKNVTGFVATLPSHRSRLLRVTPGR